MGLAGAARGNGPFLGQRRPGAARRGAGVRGALGGGARAGAVTPQGSVEETSVGAALRLTLLVAGVRFFSPAVRFFFSANDTILEESKGG